MEMGFGWRSGDCWAPLSSPIQEWGAEGAQTSETPGSGHPGADPGTPGRALYSLLFGRSKEAARGR